MAPAPARRPRQSGRRGRARAAVRAPQARRGQVAEPAVAARRIGRGWAQGNGAARELDGDERGWAGERHPDPHPVTGDRVAHGARDAEVGHRAVRKRPRGRPCRAPAQRVPDRDQHRRHGQVRGRELGQVLADGEHERACPIDAGFLRQRRVGQVAGCPHGTSATGSGTAGRDARPRHTRRGPPQAAPGSRGVIAAHPLLRPTPRARSRWDLLPWRDGLGAERPRCALKSPLRAEGRSTQQTKVVAGLGGNVGAKKPGWDLRPARR